MLRTAVAIPSPLGLLGAVPISPNIRCGAVREGGLRLLRGDCLCLGQAPELSPLRCMRHVGQLTLFTVRDVGEMMCPKPENVYFPPAAMGSNLGVVCVSGSSKLQWGWVSRVPPQR